MDPSNLSILDKISVLLKKQGKTQKALCEYLGLKQQAYTNWKNCDNDSYMKYLPQIAEYFNVSVDYLLGNASTPPEESLIPAHIAKLMVTLSEEELTELENYIHFLISKRKRN